MPAAMPQVATADPRPNQDDVRLGGKFGTTESTRTLNASG